MSDERPAFEEAVAALTRFFVGNQTLGESLHQVAELMTQALPQTDHVGITMMVDGKLKTSIFTHPEMPEIDRAQYRTGEGPCIDAYREGVAHVIDSTLERGPWQAFRDTTAPTLATHSDVVAEATSAAGATVNYTDPTATDAVDATPTVDCVPPSGLTFALGATTVNCTATDQTGNQSSSTFKVTVSDTTAPTLATHSDVIVSATSAAGATVNYTNPTASDAVDSSPTVACTPVSGSTFGPGATTVTCTATDDAGNTSPATTFKVIVKFDLKGFYQPVDMSTGSTIVWNTVKNGSTVPLKFEVFAGATELTTTSTINQPLKAVGVSCGTTSFTDEIELVATGGTVLRYDTTGGQFIYNWQTPKKSGACYKVTVETADGSSISAFFLLK